jgi:hypothetical protein
MKRLLFLMLMVIANQLHSQNLSLSLYSTGTGKNLTVIYSIQKKSMEFGIGLGCNINSIKQPDDNNNIYYKRLFATKPLHFFNFNIYYNQYVFDKFNQIKPFIFYDFQVKYSTTRSSMYFPYAIDTTIITTNPEDQFLYRNYIEYFGPFLWVENSVGIGMKINITDNFFISQKLGIGIHLIIGDEPKLFKDKTDWEFHDFYSFSLGYKF